MEKSEKKAILQFIKENYDDYSLVVEKHYGRKPLNISEAEGVFYRSASIGNKKFGKDLEILAKNKENYFEWVGAVVSLIGIAFGAAKDETGLTTGVGVDDDQVSLYAEAKAKSELIDKLRTKNIEENEKKRVVGKYIAIGFGIALVVGTIAYVKIVK